MGLTTIVSSLTKLRDGIRAHTAISTQLPLMQLISFMKVMPMKSFRPLRTPLFHKIVMLSQPKNGTHIWEINLSLLPAHKASLYMLLSADEKERCLNYKNESLRTSFIACRGSLREILSHYEPSVHPSLWHFKTTTYGRPFLSQHHPFSFNITHSKDAAYCVLSPNPICGIDTEPIVEVDLSSSFCDYTLTPHERHIIQSLPIALQDSAFTKFWCLKEARLKCLIPR